MFVATWAKQEAFGVTHTTPAYHVGWWAVAQAFRGNLEAKAAELAPMFPERWERFLGLLAAEAAARKMKLNSAEWYIGSEAGDWQSSLLVEVAKRFKTDELDLTELAPGSQLYAQELCHLGTELLLRIRPWREMREEVLAAHAALLPTWRMNAAEKRLLLRRNASAIQRSQARVREVLASADAKFGAIDATDAYVVGARIIAAWRAEHALDMGIWPDPTKRADIEQFEDVALLQGDL